MVPEVRPSTSKRASFVASTDPLAMPVVSTTGRVSPVEGATQVPSPRQKVEEEALVPELRLVTGRLPVTPVARLTLVMVLEAPLIVLLVRVSVVARPTKVSVSVGNVRVPVLEILEIMGVVRVLLVRV